MQGMEQFVGATEAHLMERIENGDLQIDEIPSRLVRYGLMEPSAFIAEMKERIEMAKEG